MNQREGLPQHRRIDIIAGKLLDEPDQTGQVPDFTLDQDEDHHGDLDVGGDVRGFACYQDDVLED